MIILLLGIEYFILHSKVISKQSKILITVILLLSLLNSMEGHLDDYLQSTEELRRMLWARRSVSFIGYSVRPFLIWLTWEHMSQDRRRFFRYYLLGLAGFNMLVTSLCFWTDLVFWYADGQWWIRGPLGFTTHAVSALMAYPFIHLMVQEYRRKNRRYASFILTFLVTIVGAVAYDSGVAPKVSVLPEMLVTWCVLYFCYYYLVTEEEYRDGREQMMRTELMMMQIKPHFINNTLNTIQALCEIDGAQAAKTTGDFARYLRVNMTSMDQVHPIPVQEEMQHTQTYVNIEKVRFPHLDVQFDLRDTDFSVPILTVQPLVENAIVHGVRGMKNGRVVIRTRLTGEGHMIEILDNGKGMPTKEEQEKILDHHHGVALKNIQYRVSTMCSGTVEIESTPGQGTTVRLLFPV